MNWNRHPCELHVFWLDTSDISSAPIHQLVQEGQQATDTWAGGLQVTGGDTAPEKSCWFLVNFSCNTKGEGKCDESMTDGCKTTLQMGATQQAIERVRVSKGTKSLGVEMRHDGKED